MSEAGSTTAEEPSFEGTVFEGMDDAEIAYFAQDQQEFKEFMNKKGIKRGDRGRLWAKLGKWRDARQQESPPKRAARRVSNRSQEVEGQGASAMIGSRHSSFLAGATEEPPRKAPANYFLSVPKTELKPNDHDLKSENFDEADFLAAVERLREKKEWVKPTKRITSLHTLLRKGSVYDTFDLDHHVNAAKGLFKKFFLDAADVSVLFGHKNQGKSQFLFFLFRLLQELGEYVVYLDKTIVPAEIENGTYVMDSEDPDYCVKYWMKSFLKFQRRRR